MWRDEAARAVLFAVPIALGVAGGGCRAILGIGDDDGASTSPADGGGADASAAGPADDGSGNDGVEAGSTEEQVPIDRRYAAWPLQPDEPALATYVVEEDVVLDTSTSLAWQRRPGEVAKANLADAKAFCDALVLGGKDDWRMPTRIELLSIFDYGVGKRGMLAAALFDGLDFTVPQVAWTASRSLLTTKGLPFALDLSLGSGAVMAGETGLNGVRCVRGGVTTMPKERWALSTTSAKDRATRLEWRLSPHPQVLPHDDALTSCASLARGGGNAWRLPTARELQSVVDEAKTDAPVHAPGLVAGEVPTEWTSTKGSATDAVIVDFRTGVGATSNTLTGHSHRCVRPY